MKLYLKILTIIFLACALFSKESHAASIIRDAEIEDIVRKISDPIFVAADLSPEAIDIYIVNNKQINAYVSGGSNIFINTGLLGMSEDPEMLIGVMAHETGHIAGGHLLRGAEQYKRTNIQATLGYMVGLAAAAVGAPQAGIAIASGAGQVAKRNFLKHTRSSEEAADQAALSYLDSTEQSATGLLKLLEVLYNKETTLYGQLNPYTLTHPLSRKRISHVKDHIAKSKYSDVTTNEDLQKKFARASVKLNAFLRPTEETLKNFPRHDKSINARYARAIAYYREPDIRKSLKEIDHLINAEPENPFFNEMKGQILFENGKIKESIEYYKKAADLLPKSALLKILLATAQISSEDNAMRKRAILNLEKALLTEKRNSFAWRQLAIAYGREKNYGMSNLALAEEALIKRKDKDVKKFVNLAKKHIKKDSPAYIRISDILTALKNKKK